MGVELLKVEHPVILQRRNCAVLLGVKTVEMGLPSVHDELSYTSFFRHYLDEVNDVIPLVNIIDSKSTLNCHRNSALLLHLSHNLGNFVRLEHQSCSEAAISYFVGGAPAVEVHFVIPVVLHDLSSLTTLNRIISTDLANDGVLVV